MISQFVCYCQFCSYSRLNFLLNVNNKAFLCRLRVLESWICATTPFDMCNDVEKNQWHSLRFDKFI